MGKGVASKQELHQKDCDRGRAVSVSAERQPAPQYRSTQQNPANQQEVFPHDRCPEGCRRLQEPERPKEHLLSSGRELNG